MRFSVRLLGPFQLSTPDGRRVEISSKKGTAVIAMLAMSRDGEHTRGWLQDRLWGSRGHAEAAGSLRRELSNLRKLLNGAGIELLVSDRDRVRLRLDRIVVDARDPSADPAIAGEFLEGFDIPGEASFRDWLREQRARLMRGPRPPAPAAPVPGGLPSHILDTSQPPVGFTGNQAIAVLPFTNVTGDETLDYLAEGISEELIVGLSRIRWLPVIARSSSFSFADTIDRKVIGQRLGAHYLIEGHLYRAYDSFGVSASLSEAATGYAIWSRRFTLQSPALRDELEQFVNELVAQLEIRIEHAEQIRIRNKRQDALGVSDLIWRGRWHLNRLTRADSDMAQKLFADALALDPDSAEALIQVTSALGWSIWAGRQPQEQILRMRKLAKQASLADPDDGRGFMLAGIAEMWLRHPHEAKTLLQHAIALNPSLALAHAQLGGCYNLAGEPAKAIDHLKASLRLSSNDPNIFYALGELAMSHTMCGRWADAAEHASLSLARRPAYWYAHVLKINALARGGHLAAARLATDELLAVKPNFSRRYIEWLPFVDRTWIDHFVEGLKMVPGRDADWLERDSQESPAHFEPN
ncbi:TPR repeat protein [Rhodopseudomonas palustris HaA2]|uniref:TPR repeat protein n=1 Tax=Rhodopseudomonas palustris (strain HaA2) TaxID=316058 RepID=Q2J1T8_RHOP2|nr:TPR repeat protein [Rhodopseudomonas palustris HaA2]